MPITYTVEQGDCLDSIAFAHDFFPDTIWNHPPNAAIRAERKDPNILYPGDVLTIPDKRINAHAAPTVNGCREARFSGCQHALLLPED